MRNIIMVVAALAACGGAAANQAEGVELDTTVCESGVRGPNVDNPFFPLPVGQKWVLEGGSARVEITVLPDVEMVGAVPARVVHEYETEGGVLVEQSWNYFAQTSDGTVCYYGERVDIYEGGVVVEHEGQWRADQNGARAGIQMPAMPMAGTYHAQEIAPGVAEDYANIVALGKPVSGPTGSYSETVLTEEWSPLEPGQKSRKAYAAGVGLLDDNGAVLVEIVRPQ